MQLVFGDHALELDKPQVMGILNLTPDSFYPSSRYRDLNRITDRAFEMVEEGVNILDIGAESTRPGASPIELNQEIDRLMPVLEVLVPKLNVPISIDTYKPEVMRQAIHAGAWMINDTRALSEAGAMSTIAQLQCPVSLMHHRGPVLKPGRDIIDDIDAFFAQQLEQCQAHGIAAEKIILDVGYGFAKSLADNLKLLNRLQRLQKYKQPLMIGLSRKGSIGKILNQACPSERLVGSLAGAIIALIKGVKWFRVHDVKESTEAITMVRAVINEMEYDDE